MANSEKRPKLIVFGLEYTLWPFWVDIHVTPPFRKDKNGDVVDTVGKKIRFYPEVPAVLERLHNEGYILGIASRTNEIPGANQLLKLFDWDKYFKYKAIYSGCIVTHFEQFKKSSGLKLEDMLLFDYETHNNRDLEEHGVISIPIPDGITAHVIDDGLKTYVTGQKGKS